MKREKYGKMDPGGRNSWNMMYIFFVTWLKSFNFPLGLILLPLKKSC